MITPSYLLRALLGLGVGSVALAGCATSSGPSQPSAAVPAKPSIATLAKQYLTIAEPANRVLDKSFDALEDNDDDLGASSALLRTIVATERSFDRELLTLKLPPAMRETAVELVRVNEAGRLHSTGGDSDERGEPPAQRTRPRRHECPRRGTGPAAAQGPRPATAGYRLARAHICDPT